MENNFYVGIVHHCKKLFKDEYNEKLVLYDIGNNLYLDLINGICYGTDINDKDYVLGDSLIVTDIDDYKINYKYLLSKYREDTLIKMKKKNM